MIDRPRQPMGLTVSASSIGEGAVMGKGWYRTVGLAGRFSSGFKGRCAITAPGPFCRGGQSPCSPGVSALAGTIPPQESWEDWLELTLAASCLFEPPG